ncbi:MAG: hypothetical protein JWN95_1333 [Frankiales bacterium]|nr:hypothetical protein [Frankiales bacterium]
MTNRTLPILRLLLAALIGLVIGAATSFAQHYLDGSWAALANSASPWLLGGFLAGALQLRRGWAITGGLAACVLEVLAYYAVTPLRGYPVNHSEIAFWAVCAVIGGPIFGWAGWAWLRAASRLQALGAAFLPATFLGEAIGAYGIRLHYYGDTVLYVLIGLVLLGVVVWRAGQLLSTMAFVALLTIVGIACYGLLLEAAAGRHFGG